MDVAETRLPLRTVAGQATFEGCLAVLRVPPEVLRTAVPSEIGLPDSESGGCSCLLVFGEQRDSTAFLGGVRMPWGIRYHELMVAIPFSRWGRSDRPVLFILGMTCDAWWAVWNGNAYYGFRKTLASISWDGERFAVMDGSHGRGFDGRVRPGARGSSGDFAWIRAAAGLPVLGQRRDGQFVESQFEWDFEGAAVETATLDLTVGEQFQALPVPMDATFQERAYLVRGMRWRLSWPAPPGR